MNHPDIAVKKFKDGFNCAQSVVYAFSDMMGDRTDHLFKAATGFGGGMGRTQEVCGAVTGGIITLSLLSGRSATDGPEKQEATYNAVRRFMQDFSQKYGTVVCGRLLDGCILLTPEGQARFKAENLKEKCCGFVAHAAELLDTIIGTSGREGSEHG